MPINAIDQGNIIGPITVGKNAGTSKTGFADHLTEFLKKANFEMARSEQMSADFAAGKNNNIHETILAAERAVITFKMVGAIRNRLLEAYQETMRMNI